MRTTLLAAAAAALLVGCAADTPAPKPADMGWVPEARNVAT